MELWYLAAADTVVRNVVSERSLWTLIVHKSQFIYLCHWTGVVLWLHFLWWISQPLSGLSACVSFPLLLGRTLWLCGYLAIFHLFQLQFIWLSLIDYKCLPQGQGSYFMFLLCPVSQLHFVLIAPLALSPPPSLYWCHLSHLCIARSTIVNF
jgi:hypothetical protein